MGTWREVVGTNYYWIQDPCKAPCAHCTQDRLHIGKSSMGWEFSFHGYRGIGIVSLKDWKEKLKTGKIVDEYGREHLLGEFLAMVEAKKEKGISHVRIELRKDLKEQDRNYIAEHPRDSLCWHSYDTGRSWLDEEGNGFQEVDFS